ncbi:MAG: class I SAM-dependent methyltransferase [Owenweeksia sp.]
MDQENVARFYDDFVEKQSSTGINARLYSLKKRLLKKGLGRHSRVLELGCGIGAMTYLITKTVKEGYIESVDLSSASIAHAREKLPQNNIHFAVGDVTTYQPVQKDFDFILLFDVIEHIPLDQHSRLFANLSTIAGDSTRILINIPNPAHVQHDQHQSPELLQVIDQPVPIRELVGNIDENGLELRFFETYSIWLRDDYQFFEITLKQPFRRIRLQDGLSFFPRMLGHLQRAWRKRINRF